KLRRGRLGEVDLGDQLRVLLLVALDRVLRQRKVARDIDDIDGDRRRPKRAREAKQRRAKGARAKQRPACAGGIRLDCIHCSSSGKSVLDRYDVDASLGMRGGSATRFANLLLSST